MATPSVAELCPPSPRESRELRTASFWSFTCAIELVTTSPTASLAEARRRLEAWGRQFSRFEPGSEVSRFNANAGGWVEVSPGMHELLTLGLRAAVGSRGLFNITAPATEFIEPKPCRPVTEVLELKPRQARLRPGHSVDFGGIAKGLWADRLCELLGPTAACSVGGDVACRGDGPSGEGWPVSLPDGRVLVLRNAAVATSGIGRRRRGSEHHIVDPRTGRSSGSDVVRASVMARRCATAEWVATSLVVGGTEALPPLSHASTFTPFLEIGAA